MMMMMITFCTPFVFISQHVYEALGKKLRLLGPSRMDVCSVALGLEWLRIIMSFVEIFPTCFHERTFIEIYERERKGGTFRREFPLSIR